MKLIKSLILIVIVLVVLIGISVAFYIDAIARTGVEQGAQYAMQVPTSLEKADVRLFAGGFAMEKLNVGNPQGYEAEYFLRLGKSDVNVSLGTLMQDTVVIPSLQMEDLSIVLEKKDGKTNLDTIMANIGRLSSSETSTEGGKKFIVNEVVIRNVELRVIMPPMGTVNKPVVVTVPEIRLKDLGSDTPNGVVMSQLTGTIVSATLRAIATNAPDVLGNVVVASIDSALSLAGDIGKVGGEIVGKAAQIGAEATKVIGEVAGEGVKAIEGAVKQGEKALEGVGSTIESAGKALDGTGKKLDDAAKGIGNVLKGLGGGNKDEKKDE